MPATLPIVASSLNAAWFAAGFISFTFRSRAHARGLLRGQSADVTNVVAAVLRFLGGLNLALAALSVIGIVAPRQLLTSHGVGAVLLVAALAHWSQVAVNAPIAAGELRGRREPWPVLRGLMLVIFAGDVGLGSISLVVGVLLVS